ncbi:MAG: hypothetical protein AB7G87_10525 [Clostridia bacterium]
MNISELYRILRPLRWRIYLNRLINCLLAAGCIGFGVIAVIQMMSIFIPISFMFAKVVMILLVCIAGSFIASVFLMPDYIKTAQHGDRLGLEERLTTALELKDEQSAIAKIQRFDTIKIVKSVSFRDLYPVKADHRKLMLILCMIVIAFISSMIPADSKEIAKQQEKVRKEIKKQVEQVQKEQKKVSSNRELTADEIKELNLQLKQLEKDLHKTRNQSEAIKALARAQNKLSDIQQKHMDKDLSKLGERLSQFESTKELGEALKKGQYDEIEKRLEEFAERLQQMNEQELEKMAESIEKLAQEIASNPQLADALQQLAQSMQSGNSSQQMANLSALMSRMAQSSALNQAVQQLASAMQQSRSSISGAAPGQLQNPTLVSGLSPSSQGSTDGSQSSGQGGNGQGNQPGSNSGSGSGTGNGQGSGNGSGTGGSGAGSGTGNGSDSRGSGSSSGNGQGKAPGEKHVRDYEQIFTSKRLGGEGEVSNVSGTQNDSGQVQQIEVDNGPILRGESLPYNEVYQQYKYEAMQSVQRSSIPTGMRSLVEEYFSSLE